MKNKPTDSLCNLHQICRIQLTQSTDSALNKYGFLNEEKVEKYDISNYDIDALLPDFKFDKESGEVSFSASKNEDWIGFGDVTRERMFHRGHKIDCWVKNVSSYIPIPFFISTKGYAILVNSTHKVEFDVCASTKNRFSWLDNSGKIDFYFFNGGSFKENIRLYTQLTGKPELPPEWAFGLWYICREQANDYEAVNDAVNFRKEGIPCDVIGLEPGWMEKKYDLSPDKKWHPEKFPIPEWCPNGPHNFIDSIRRMGFRFELWECNEYDLSYEEERRLGKKTKEVKEKSIANYHTDGETDDHFLWPRYSDTLTKKEEPWFEHHKKFMDQGADFFKQDGTYQICPHPDKLWGNGMLDDEMHNLYPLLYSRQMKEGITEHTKKRAVVFTVAGWTGFQSLCGTWTGDVGGRLETLASMLSTSVFSHNWVTNDMEVMQPEGIHFGYLQPWSQINSWTYFRMPWAQGDALCEMHKYYSRLRSRLIPYIYSWAQKTSEDGIPLLMRPLQIEFEKDINCREILHEYLLGRDILVSIYKKEVYFPAGKWKDFWTGKVYEGEKTHKVNWPENRGGNLFIREGAIIPFGPIMQYRKEKPLDEIELYLFPSETKSEFSFYEDDGVSFDYQKGACAVTDISVVKKDKTVEVLIEKPNGRFKNMPKKRKWELIIALDSKPDKIILNNAEVTDFTWDPKRKEAIGINDK
jgi:alpha-glucosidase (family GH31 glycosyl hydrolase)